MYVHAWYGLNEKWIKYGIIILKYGVFILFGENLWRRDLSCRDTLAWIQRCPSSQVLLYFHPIFTCVFHASIMQFFHTVHFHTSSHWLTTWRGNSTSTYKSLFTCASYIAHYRSNGYAPLHRTLSLKWIWPAVSETLVLNETKPTKRSQITDQNLRKEANAKCAVSVHAKRVSNS